MLHRPDISHVSDINPNAPLAGAVKQPILPERMFLMANALKRTPPPATYQDVLDAPPHKVAEVTYGVLHMQPRPAMPHARASSILGMELGSPFDRGTGGPGGWWIVFEPELHLGDDILVPDLAGWRRETLPVYPDAAYCTVAPDWVCEVLSPSTRRLDLTDKREIYAREGVSHIWFIDPDARTLEAFRLGDEDQWILIASLSGNAPVSVAPFDAISFPLGSLWPDGGKGDGDGEDDSEAEEV